MCYAGRPLKLKPGEGLQVPDQLPGQLGRQTVEVRRQRLWVKLCACRGPLVRMKAFNPEQDRRRLRSGCLQGPPRRVQEDEGAHVAGAHALRPT